MSTVAIRWLCCASYTRILRSAYALGCVGQSCGPGQFGPIVTTPERRPRACESRGSVGDCPPHATARLRSSVENRASHFIVSAGVMMSARLAHNSKLRRVESGTKRVAFPLAVNAEHVHAAQRFDLGPHRKLRRMTEIAQQTPERVVFEIDHRLGTEQRDELDR